MLIRIRTIKQKRLLGKTAFVTGASGGLEADFAREQAGLGRSLTAFSMRLLPRTWAVALAY